MKSSLSSNAQPATLWHSAIKRHWFTFGTKTLLLGTTLSALGMMWCRNVRERYLVERNVAEEVHKLSGATVFEPQEPALLHNVLGVRFAPYFERLVEVSARWPGVDGKQIAVVQPLRNLRRLFLHSAAIDDDDIARLGPCLRAVEELELSETLITDRSLRQIAALRRIFSLDLEGCRISDEGISAIAALPIEFLNLDDTTVGDRCATCIGGFSGLLRLRLKNTRLTDQGVKRLGSLEKLCELDVSGTAITDAAVPYLCRLTGLEALTLDRTRITGSGLKQLDALPKLKYLSLLGTDIDDYSLASLVRMRSLTVVRLSGRRITNAGMDELALVLSLENVYLDETAVNERGAESMRHLPKLKLFSLTGASISEAEQSRLEAAMPAVKLYFFGHECSQTVKQFSDSAAWRFNHGHLDEAMADATRALQIQPRCSDALGIRGAIRAGLGDLTGAVDDFTDAISENPYDAFSYSMRGDLLACFGEYSRAAADLAEATRLNPDIQIAQSRRAWLLATCPDPDIRNAELAVAAATQACALTKYADGHSLEVLAAAFAESGDFASALRHVTEAFRRAPEDTDVQQRATAAMERYHRREPFRDYDQLGWQLDLFGGRE